jgi:hypothetical protein
MINSVFLSFDPEDREFGRRLLKDLSRQAVNVFVNDQVRAGPQWGETLRRGIDETDAVVAVLTDFAIRGGIVLSEIGAAMAAHKPIIWIIPRNRKIPAGLPRALTRLPILRISKLADDEIGPTLRERLNALQDEGAAA